MYQWWVKPQTCVQLFEEEDGGKGEGKESWMSRWLEARETERADSEAGREWVKQEGCSDSQMKVF